MKHAVASGMIIGQSSAFLWHFSNIVRLGQHPIQEPNPVILMIEIIGLLFILGYGCWYLVKGFR